MPIDKINPHYSFSNPASVYDEESMTALELAGRTAAKVNETVEAFNTHEVEMWDAHNKLVEQTLQSQAMQDDKIDTMIETGMPNAVKAEFTKNLVNGTFEDMIDEHAGLLTDRLDNITQAVTPGSTSGDAELIDGRTDTYGIEHPNVGTAVRAVTGYLDENIRAITVPDGEMLELSIVPGHADMWGGLYYNPASYEYAHKIAKVSVQPGERYTIRTSYMDSLVGASFYSGSTFISAPLQSPGVLAQENYKKIIVVPAGADTMYISSLNGLPMGAMRITGAAFNPSSIATYLKNAMDSVDNGTPVMGDNLCCGYVVGQLIDGTSGVIVESLSPNYVVATIPVQEGERYHIESASARMFAAYALYDKHGVMIGGTGAVDYDAPSEVIITVERNITIPFGCVSMSVCHNVTRGVPVARKVYGYAPGPNWSHLKWCSVGDSLTEVNRRTSKNYVDYIRDRTGINVANFGNSGTGYKMGDAAGSAFYQRVSGIPADCNVVTIFGSGNDISDILELGTPSDTGTATICGCIHKTIDNIYAANPGAILGIIAPTPWHNRMPGNEKMDAYCAALEQIAQQRCIPYLDLYHGSGMRPNDQTFREMFYSKDEGNGIHPDEAGHKRFAGHVLKFLESLIGCY